MLQLATHFCILETHYDNHGDSCELEVLDIIVALLSLAHVIFITWCQIRQSTSPCSVLVVSCIMTMNEQVIKI